jgi:hypothetical protein
MGIRVETEHDNNKNIKNIKDYFIVMHSKVDADELVSR